MAEQHTFGNFEHDSLQYHFFCGDIVGAGRLFSTQTLEHASFWIYDGVKFHELYCSDSGYDRNAKDRLNVSCGELEFVNDASVVTLRSKSTDGTNTVTVRFTPQKELKWADTISTVTHQPNLKVELDMNGTIHTGIGYCKRYSWTPAPTHWGYRFIQGFLDAGNISVWTAEATFGLGKYDYFKMLMPGGELITTSVDVSCHRLNGAYAISSIGPIEINIEELCVWETQLKSDAMDSMMRQCACKMTVKTDHWEKQGLAINETCFGTLG